MLQSETRVREFRRLMATNEFERVKTVLAESFVLDWRQFGERIRGAANYIQMNFEYPAAAPWQGTIERLIANDCEVVTHVSVADGTRTDPAISFFEIAGGSISRITEFWPEPYQPRAHRRRLVERIE